MDNTRKNTDALLVELARYVVTPLVISDLAYQTAQDCLFDALGCAMSALSFPHCRRLIGPIVPNTRVPLGAHVPGTDFYLDPVQAAFSLGTMIRWLDYNDTWLAAEWGHPSDNIGAILTVAEYVSHINMQQQKPPLSLQHVLDAIIKAYEIQGILALHNSFNARGYDHVILVKLASTALATYLLGGTQENIEAALSQAWMDGPTLRAYRHAPNTGARKSWAAGDACARAVWLSLLTMRGECAYASVLSTPKWGFEDVFFHHAITCAQPLGSYVVENILFKVQYPAEFHAQTAVEAAVQLHPQVRDRLAEIQSIQIVTQEPALRIIDKSGPLYNVADRDHCLQYMVAIALIYGTLKATDYLDEVALDPRIDTLRQCMQLEENPAYTKAYYDPNQRAIPNAVQVFFRDGTSTEQIVVEYPLGHRFRRKEARPALQEKFYHNVSSAFGETQTARLIARMQEYNKNQESVVSFVGEWL